MYFMLDSMAIDELYNTHYNLCSSYYFTFIFPSICMWTAYAMTFMYNLHDMNTIPLKETIKNEQKTKQK